MVNEELLQAMRNAYGVCNTLEINSNTISQLKKKQSYYKGKTDISVLSTLVTVGKYAFLVFAGIGIIETIVGREPALLLFPVFDVLISLVGAPSLQKYLLKKKEQNESSLNKVETELNDITEKYIDYFRKNINYVTIVPENYRYSMAFKYMASLLETERAHTLPECLDKLEEQIHRWNMESASAQMLQNQMSQSKQLSNIQTATTVSAVANSVSAVADILRFFN